MQSIFYYHSEIIPETSRKNIPRKHSNILKLNNAIKPILGRKYMLLNVFVKEVEWMKKFYKRIYLKAVF